MRRASLAFALSMLALPAVADDNEREARIAGLVELLTGEDDAKATEAERHLWHAGGDIERHLEKALAGASPAAKERIARLRRWLAPSWPEDADDAARKAYTKQLPEVNDAWSVLTFDRIELTGAGEPLVAAYRLFRAECRSKSGVQAKYDLVLAAKDGSQMLWTGEAAQCREVLQRCGLTFDGGDATKRGIGALVALPRGGYRAKGLDSVEFERLEVKGREAIWHAHRMWFGSGVLGGYTEDVVYVFGDDGLLAEVKTTGIPSLTKREMDRILDEADPWLVLEGWVADSTKDALQKAQAGKEKSPPRHEEK